MQNFQRLMKNKAEFPREIKKNSCEISRGLGFLALKFLRHVTYIILSDFQGWSFVLRGIFRGIEKNQKNSRVFFKNVLNPPSWFFFWNIPFQNTIDLNWSHKALAQKEALTLCQDRACASFSCVLSLSSVLGMFRFIGESSTPAWEVKSPSSPTFPIYIFAVILSKAGENPQP